MDLKIAGKRALVCAASQGMGKATAMSLAEEGVELFMCARSEGPLNAVADEIEKRIGRKVHRQTCDLTDKSDRELLIKSVEQLFPGIDILIHNVGGPKSTSVQDTSLTDWGAGFQLLFLPVAHLNQAFLPGMKDRRWGRIATITSTSAIEPIPHLAISNALRSAVTSMTKTLADEVAQYNITVNCVAPGAILTDRTEDLLQSRAKRTGQTRDEYFKEYVGSIPAGRLGTPEEFAAAMTFLCSEQASYITGSTLYVDGGRRKSVV